MSSHNLADLPAEERQKIEDEKTRLFENWKRGRPKEDDARGRK